MQINTNMLLLVNIFGGMQAASYPFNVFVDVNGRQFGGTLITSDAVITAASSIHNDEEHRNAYPTEIFIMKQEAPGPLLRWYKCASFRSHNRFDPNFGASAFDIAIIKIENHIQLNNDTNQILPPCPDSEEYLIGFSISMTSILLDRGRFRGLLSTQQVEEGLVKYLVCQLHFFQQTIQIDKNRQVCYGTSDYNAIIGASGREQATALVFKYWLTDESFCFIGIASYNPFTRWDDPGTPKLFVNVPSFVEWISDTLLYLNELDEAILWKTLSSLEFIPNWFIVHLMFLVEHQPHEKIQFTLQSERKEGKEKKCFDKREKGKIQELRFHRFSE